MSHTLASVAHLVVRPGARVQGYPTALPPQARSARASVADGPPSPTGAKRVRLEVPPLEAMPRASRVLSLDPSSSCTGWAVLEAGGRLVACGKLSPRRSRDDANARIEAMVAALPPLLLEHRPDAVVLEDTSGKVGARHGGGGAGLAIHGKAVGALWRECVARASRVEMVLENTWTRAGGRQSSKKDRTARVAYLYAGKGYDVSGDVGGDVADAIGLGRWWLERFGARAGGRP